MFDVAPRVWGVTRCKDYFNCPAYFVGKYEQKLWQDEENDAMKRGKQIHSDLEQAVKYGLQLPADLSSVAPYVYALGDMKQRGIFVQPEFKFGLDIHRRMVEFFRGANLRARFALDVAVRDGNRGLAVDWKTGQYRAEHNGEAKTYGAALGVALQLPEVEVQYIYIDHPEQSFSVEVEPNSRYTEMELFMNQADEALASMGSNPVRKPGKHCYNCGDVNCPHKKTRK